MALPANLETFGQFQRAGVLHDADANVRLHVFRALADIPASGEVGRALFQLGREDAILEDEWLPTALFLAAARHAEGFLDAFADEVGALEFARIAGRAARGELGDVADLSAPSLDDAAWRTLALPATWAQTPLGRFTGALWVRRELELPASAAGAPATLHLGRVRENAVAFVNGTRLGEGERGADRPRTYTIPAGVLAAGRNVIALRVSNRRTGAGFASTADSLFLEVAGLHAPLAGDWKYEVEAEWPGGRPPDFVSGVPFAHQFLKYDNPFVGEAARRPAGDEPPAATVSLRTLPGQNRFDRSTIPVRAGQRVVVSFANNDEMPHNVVVLERGADVERAGGLLNEFMTQPAAAAADYVPPALAVIAAGPMVAPGATGTLTFTAPSEPGDYPFICSFPGHWLTMRGVLRVER
jgi:azurin